MDNINAYMKNIIRILIIVVVFGTGVFVASAWINTDKAEKDEAIESERPAINGDTYVNWDSEKATIELFEKAAPAVVYITTSSVQRNYWSRNAYEVPSGSGSGFIWDTKGHIVTNFHVIQGASTVNVVLNDQSAHEAEVVGRDETKDIAVLRIKANKNALTPLPVGASDDLKVGQSVFAIGNPFGLDQTLTTGIVSALGREITSVANTQINDVIQTDAAINPGNSGGPLLDSRGQLIGINTAIYSPSGASAGIGFSVPVNVVKFAVPEIIKYGKVRRPFLGVRFFEESEISRLRRLGIEGLLVREVFERTAAAKAGIRPTRLNSEGRMVLGDLIIGVDGKEVKTIYDLMVALEGYSIGDNITLEIVRDRQPAEVKVLLEEIR